MTTETTTTTDFDYYRVTSVAPVVLQGQESCQGLQHGSQCDLNCPASGSEEFSNDWGVEGFKVAHLWLNSFRVCGLELGAKGNQW